MRFIISKFCFNLLQLFINLNHPSTLKSPKHVILINNLKDNSNKETIRNIITNIEKETHSKIIFENELLNFNINFAKKKTDKSFFHHDFLFKKSKFYGVISYANFCELEHELAVEIKEIVESDKDHDTFLIVFDDLEFLYDESIISELIDIDKNYKNYDIQKYILIDIDDLPEYNLPIIKKDKDKLIFFWDKGGLV